MPEWLNVPDVVTGVSVAAILAIGAGLWVLGKRLLGASYKTLLDKRPTTVLFSAERYNAIWEVMGESTLGRLESTWVGPDDSSESTRSGIEIETERGDQVWEVSLFADTSGTDLALAARVKLGLTDQFYRFHHVGPGRDLAPEEPVLSQVSLGDRLRLVPNGHRIWGVDSRLGPLRWLKGFLSRLISKKIRVD